MNMDKEEGPRSFANKCKTEAVTRNVNAKGAMTIKLGFDVTPHGTVTVNYDVNTVEPKRHRMTDTMFLSKGGNITTKDERQPSLPGVRDVSAPKKIKDPMTPDGELIDPETGEVLSAF